MVGASWAVWLAVPLVVPVLVAVVMWWRGRPRRPDTMPQSIAGHRDFLHALDPGARVGGAQLAPTARTGPDTPTAEHDRALRHDG
jgi:hypothetical protein